MWEPRRLTTLRPLRSVTGIALLTYVNYPNTGSCTVCATDSCVELEGLKSLAYEKYCLVECEAMQSRRNSSL
jgi:hypothetical protein